MSQVYFLLYFSLFLTFTFDSNILCTPFMGSLSYVYLQALPFSPFIFHLSIIHFLFLHSLMCICISFLCLSQFTSIWFASFLSLFLLRTYAEAMSSVQSVYYVFIAYRFCYLRSTR